MIRNTSWKWMSGGLSAALLGFALVGCGGNQATDETATTTTTKMTETAPHVKGDGHDHAGSQAKHTEGDGHDHAVEIETIMARFFPSAQLKEKTLPMNNDIAKHMSEEAGVKFTGKESNWQVFEATQNGKRIGLAMMTHSALPDGKDMHIAFAVNPEFTISHITSLDAPDNDKLQGFAKQLVGKKHGDSFKVGKGLKAVPGLSPQVAQIAADAVHKGVVMLDEFFNPAHEEHEHGDHNDL